MVSENNITMGYVLTPDQQLLADALNAIDASLTAYAPSVLVDASGVPVTDSSGNVVMTEGKKGELTDAQWSSVVQGVVDQAQSLLSATQANNGVMPAGGPVTTVIDTSGMVPTMAQFYSDNELTNPDPTTDPDYSDPANNNEGNGNGGEGSGQGGGEFDGYSPGGDNSGIDTSAGNTSDEGSGASWGGGGFGGDAGFGGGDDCGDPIILDLNGDGIDLLAKGSVRFNLYNQTNATASTGWVGAQDGLLVMDLNHDGRIDTSRELLSEFFNAPTTEFGTAAKPTFANGWAALQYLESTALLGNHDGVLDVRDLAFKSLRVWQDADSDGVTDAGELKTLGELGITAISTRASDATQTTLNGQTIDGTATFTRNGQTWQMADVVFDADANSSRITTDGNFTQIDTAAGSRLLYAQGAATLDLSPFTGAGQSYAYGSSGNDTIIGSAGNDILTTGGGDDIVRAGAGDDVLHLTGAQTSGNIDLGDGVDTLVVSGNEGATLILAQAHAEIAYGGAGDDLLVGGGTTALYIDGGAGNDVIAGSSANDHLIGGDGNDQIFGLNGNDSIEAGAGNNFVDGGAGDNTLAAGDGNNVLRAGDGNNTITAGNGDNSVTVGDGGNTIALGNGDNTLVTGIGVNVINAGTGNNTFVINNVADVVTVQAGGINTIRTSVDFTASANVQKLTGIGSADLVLTGNELDNHIVGNAGNNSIDGGSGADTMTGGLGDDTYSVDNAGDVVVEEAGGGLDTILSSVTYTLAENVENLTLTGTQAINGSGNALDNTLIGNSGDNLLDGGLGADTTTGGAGDDTCVVDNTGDLVTENLAEGMDTVFSSISYVLPENVENLTLTGTDNLDGTGNALNNVLQGNAGANTLDGDLGADTMSGDAGDDLYIVDNAGDLVAENADAGIDTVKAGVNYALTANVENLLLTGNATTGGGNELDNIITANDLGNTLAGAAGNDTLIGGAGSDTLDGGRGADVMNGGRGNDILIGDAGDDSFLYARGDGLDRISDASGTDSFVMGQGMTLDNIAVRVFEQADGSYQAQLRLLDANGCEIAVEGADFAVTRQANGSWLSPIERFVFADGSVNTFDDVLIKTVNWQFGNSQQIIRTGRDDDIIHVGNHPNTVYSGTGNDIIYTGNSGDFAFGEGGLDYLSGGNGDDVLDGGCGVDVMVGGNGRDVLRDGGENSAFLGGQGDDMIHGSDGSDFVAGGKHRDQIRLGAGNNVVAFNRQDGDDIIYTADSQGRNTLSLGGGVQYADLAFQKSSQDLVLQLKGGDSITLKDWYASTANRDFVTLQVIEAAAKDYRPGSSDVLRDDQVEQFDFLKLVDTFDQALAVTPDLTSWALTNALLDAHLGGSNTAALGGDLAYDYGMRGDLAGLNLSAAQDTLKNAHFGQANQHVHSWSSVSSSNAVRLS